MKDKLKQINIKWDVLVLHCSLVQQGVLAGYRTYVSPHFNLTTYIILLRSYLRAPLLHTTKISERAVITCM